MKKMSLLVVIVLAALGAAAQKPDDHAITVHVSSARTILTPANGGAIQYQQLNVSINGKKYELRAISDGSLLTLGDYKAKLAEDKHKTPYESLQAYEFLFSDGKTVKFTVTGQSE
jgi:hypothetical protein